MPQRNHVVRYLADVVRHAQRVPPVGAVEVSVYPPVAGRDFGEEGGVCLWVPGVSKGEGFNEGQRGDREGSRDGERAYEMRQPAEPEAAPFAGPMMRAGPGTEPAEWVSVVVDGGGGGVEVGRVGPGCEVVVVVVHCSRWVESRYCISYGSREGEVSESADRGD